MISLVQDARSRSRPDPSAILSVGKDTKNTRVIYRTDAPVWEEGFTFLVNNPETDTLTVRVSMKKRLQVHFKEISLASKKSREIEGIFVLLI